MQPIDWQDEFQPLNEESVDFLINLSKDLQGLSHDEEIGHEARSLISVASYQIVRLTAMASAGFALFADNKDFAIRMLHDIDRLCSHIRRVDPDGSEDYSLAAEAFKMYLEANQEEI